MVKGYKPQDFSFFHRGGKISTTLCGWDDADVDGAGCLFAGIICDSICVSKMQRIYRFLAAFGYINVKSE